MLRITLWWLINKVQLKDKYLEYDDKKRSAIVITINAKDQTKVRKYKLIIAVLIRIYQQERKERDVGRCLTMYIIISQMH